MSNAMRFKFKYLSTDGQEAGVFSKKGSFDGTTLTIDGTPIVAEVVLRAMRRFNRLVLHLLQKNGTVEAMAIAITSGNAKKLASALNRTTSQRWADLRKEALRKRGKGELFQTRTCPYCDAIVDLSGMDQSAQMYCPYCDSIITLRMDGPVEEADVHACDGCGLYARPREFTVMYFYFLLVVWGYRYRKVYRCSTCMRPDAWKMFFGNAPFLLGLPVAITQLVRVYTGDRKAFAGLDRANELAKRGRVQAAVQQYEQIEQRLQSCASVHFNHGMLLARSNRLRDAADQFYAALDDCSNFTSAYEALCQCLQQLGEVDELRDLKAQWEDADEKQEVAG